MKAGQTPVQRYWKTLLEKVQNKVRGGETPRCCAVATLVFFFFLQTVAYGTPASIDRSSTRASSSPTSCPWRRRPRPTASSTTRR